MRGIIVNRKFHGIGECCYYYDLKLGGGIYEEPILGEFWKNVTIVILSLDRSQHTLLLLKSLSEHCLEFKGKILIVDNGSQKEELEILKRKSAEINLDITIHEIGENLGVAKGRNLAFKMVDTDWIFSLDNDIFFVDNPFPKVEQALLETGARFCNLPLLNNDGENYITNGGHLWVSENGANEYFVSCGPVFMLERDSQNTVNENALSTYLYGGCAFYHKQTFFEAGGFDENYFIGYEDIDYSLKIYRKGLKIANCSFGCLIHNHPQSSSITSYDKKRYKYEIMKRSADYFWTRNKLRVWNESTESFFAVQSQKQVLEEQYSLEDIYANAKKNYREVSYSIKEDIVINKTRDFEALDEMIMELQQIDDELRVINKELQEANVKLGNENKELRTYGYSQDKAIEDLRKMNEELRAWSRDLEEENRRLKNRKWFK